MNDTEDALICVHRAAARGPSRERALVLESLGIPYVQQDVGHEHLLLVPAEHEPRARRELAEFDTETSAWPPPPLRIEAKTEGLGAALVYCVVIGGAFLVQTSAAYGIDWTERGLVSSRVVEAGEWWRAACALTLHADVIHLAGNLLFGAVFVAVACQLLGSGVGLFLVVLSGVLGNLLNALVRDVTHTSLGASTAVFGAVGVIVSYQWQRRRAIPSSPLKQIVPLGVGLAFLGFLGVSEGRTDVFAHVAGFSFGLLLGAGAAALEPSGMLRPAVQRGLGALALLILGVAWALALR